MPMMNIHVLFSHIHALVPSTAELCPVIKAAVLVIAVGLVYTGFCFVSLMEVKLTGISRLQPHASKQKAKLFKMEERNWLAGSYTHPFVQPMVHQWASDCKTTPKSY